MNTNTQETINDSKRASLEQTAYALNDTLGRFSDKDVPTHVRAWSVFVK